MDRNKQPIYKLIHSEEEIITFIDSLPDLKLHERFYMVLLARRKYYSKLSRDRFSLRRFTCSKDRILDRIHQLELKLGSWRDDDGTPIPPEALALYIAPNPRCQRLAAVDLGGRIMQMLNNNKENVNIETLLKNSLHGAKSRSHFVSYDIDTKDITDFNLPFNEGSYFFNETSGGYHLHVIPSKIQDNKDWYKTVMTKYGEVIDQKGDLLTPIAGTYQSNFKVQRVKN